MSRAERFTVLSVATIAVTCAATPVAAYGISLAAGIVLATFGVFASGYFAGRRDESRARSKERR